MKKLALALLLAALAGVSYADTVTTSLQLLLMTAGTHSNDWGSYTNINMQKIESATEAATTVASGGGGTVTLTNDQARYQHFSITGVLSSNSTITWPSTARKFVAQNNTSGAYSVTAKCGAGATVTLTAGNLYSLYCDGSNVYKAHSDIATSEVVTASIADSAVTSVKIADGTIATADIGASQITTSLIADSNVTTAKIADSNVTTAKIADSNVTTAKIADSNVTTAKIADSNVTTAKIADANVTPAKLSQPLTEQTKQATTSGTSISFTSVPSWASKIKMVLKGVSTNGTAAIRFRAGTSSTAATSGYVSLTSVFAGGAQSQTSQTVGCDAQGSGAAVVRHAMMEFIRIDSSTNFWMITGNVLNDNTSVELFSCYVNLSGTLDSVFLTTTNGTDAFDAGSANISYQ